MRKRTVLTIEPSFDETIIFRLFKTSININDARIPGPFNCNPDQMPAWTQPAAVQQHGQKILQALTSHQPVSMALNMILGTPFGEVHALYFALDVEEVENLCWETLCNQQGTFLALDQRWPIARMARSVIDRPMPVHNFDSPLKILAVLSAMNIKAELEWNNLKQAVENARQKGLDIKMKVLVGEEDLLQTIQAELDNELTGVEVDPVPDRTSDLAGILKDFRPNIVHFFCHGNTGFGAAWLELATILDRLQNKPNGSVNLSMDQLSNMLLFDELWLVTLNCCKGGQAEEDLHSMAHQLVANGVPAAIGMLEPIDAGDAHEFCAGFYPAVFDLLQATFDKLNNSPEAQAAEIEWAEALWPARADLCEKYNNDPVNNREWALPVLYVQTQPFHVDLRLLREQKQRAQAVAGALQALPPDTPDAVRTQLLAMLADIPEELRPDQNGSFSGDNFV